MSLDQRKAISTENAPAALGPYSQAIEVDGWVYCSGQIPIVPGDGSIKRGIQDQAQQALSNLGEVLKAAGCELSDVVKTQVYLSDMGDFAAVNEVYAGFFCEPFPARVCIQAAALPKGVDVEVDAIARKRDSR
ncbi:MAG: RidA family protein [Planctomycetia bacterium]|nr:RidA family protein [Planctomycetia bacterium]MBL6915756.1 RidA family protein [Planctomycetota bacterium]HCW45453.1 reactive intermediate/imine deaminase [Planctomycetota bacterium]